MSEEVKNELEVADEKKVPGSRLDYMDGASLNKAYRNAQVLATSSLIPDAYKNKPQDILVAMDLASRTNFGLMTVLQNLYLVKGHPAWSGQFCVAAIKGCGKYKNVKYVWVGEKGTESFGCYLSATEVETGETVKGTTVDWKMVKSFGWDSKPGSMWKSMEEQMFRYRAAAYFARTECPETLMGLYLADEIRDTYGYDEPKKQKTKVTLDDVYVESEVQ